MPLALEKQEASLFVTIPSSLHHIDAACQQVREFLVARDKAPLVFRVCLGLREALTNAVRHGNRLNPERRVELHLHLGTRGLVITVEDEGPGFDPDDRPPPDSTAEHGRGLAIMEAYFTRLSFNPTGNRLTLELRFH